MPVSLEESIKQTQRTLKPIFSKPKCTTKLLSKPPFRFIHDIVTATMVATGFPKNYFSAQQLGSKNLKDKTSKIAFLDKLIYLVGVCHGIEVDVRPSKIVAGAEPLDTNMLLTLFGQAAVNPNLDHAAVIKHCQFGGKIGDNSFMKNVHPKLKSKDGIEEEGEEKHTEQDVSGPEGSNNLNEKPKTLPSPERLSETKDKDEDPIKERKEEKQLRGMDLLQQKIKQCNSDLTITKQTIASIVTKPKCSEKLLKKPPFRFLHDLIMAVNKATGLGLERIYSHDEMDSSNCKTKDAKIKFLEKICNHVGDELGITIDLRPSKVVAGLESEKTCQFLQLFALLSLNQETISLSSPNEEKEIKKDEEENIDTASIELSSQAKDAISDGGIKEESTVGNNDEKESHDNSVVVEHDIKETSFNDLTNPLPPEEERQEYVAETKTDVEPTSTIDTNDNSDTKSIQNDDEHNTELTPSSEIQKDEEKSQEFDSIEIVTKDIHKDKIAHNNEVISSTEEKRRSSPITEKEELKTEELQEEKTGIEQTFFGVDNFQDEVIVDEVKQSMSRPKTARRRPPRIKERVQSAENKDIVAIERPIIFKDNDGEPNTDANVHNNNSLKTSASFNKERENGNGTNIENSVKLHLRLGKRSSNNTKSSEFTTTTTTIPYDLGAITQSIQSIARAAAPIGRVMDYLPTEINAMVKERESWRDEYERQSNEFVREKKKTEVELEPVHAQVKAAEDEIEHMKELILKKKAQIGQNEKWIESHMKRITMLLPK